MVYTSLDTCTPLIQMDNVYKTVKRISVMANLKAKSAAKRMSWYI